MQNSSKSNVWLDSIDITQMSAGWGLSMAGKTVLERPLTLRGTVFEHGVGTHADSEFIVDLHGEALRFEAVVGVDDEVWEQGNARFQIWLDGIKIADSGNLTSNDAPAKITADLAGGRILMLVVTDDVNQSQWSHADWCDAFIEMKPGATAVPVCPVRSDVDSAPPVVNRVDDSGPRINHPRVAGATPGRPFLFRIPASGRGPLSFSVQSLPEGLVLDRATGIITGALAQEGSTAINVTVANAEGTACETITITGGCNKLLPTPPMGWNSWNVWGLAVDQDKVKAAADMIVGSGLAAHGFQYVNIDDGWEAGRAPDGTILCNEKFPDMKGLSDYVHSKGLKFGIYSSPGPLTCGGFMGSYRHEEQDARTYASWGVDYLKYDWCSYSTIAKDKTLPELQKPYRIMTEALAKCDRDIVHSFCQYGNGRVWEWGREIGGQVWRTTGDITDTWSSLRNIGFRQHPHFPYAGPGGWNDPDMLVLGWVGWGPKLHETGLNRHEQLTHMSLWCMLSAPLLLGCDLTRLDDWTLSLLTNDEVIALDQDPLGNQARRVFRENNLEIWVKPLWNGDVAIGMFNLRPNSSEITAIFEQIGIQGEFVVRDLWKREDLGVFDKDFRATVAPHGVTLVRMRRKG